MRFLVLLVAAFLIASSGVARPDAMLHPVLREGDRVRFDLAAGHDRAWTVELDQGDFLHLELDQVTADGGLHVESHEGEELFRANLRQWARGTEIAAIVAPSTGVYRVRVTNLGTRPGELELRVLGLRPATERDLVFLEAEAALVGAHDLGSTVERWEADAQRALEAAAIFRKLGLFDRELSALRQSANRLHRAGRSAEARARLESTVETARAAGNLEEVAKSLMDVAVVIGESDADLAVELTRQAVEAAVAADSPIVTAQVRSNLALYLAYSGSYDGVFELHDLANDAYRRFDAGRPLAYNLHNVGTLHYDLGDATRALDAFTESKQLLEKISDHPALSVVLAAIADVQLSLGDLEGALVTSNQAVQNSEVIGDARGVAYALMGAAEAHSALGNTTEAESMLRQALQRASSTEHTRLQGEVQSSLGRLLISTGDLDAGCLLLGEGLDVRRDAGATIEADLDRIGLAPCVERAGEARAVAELYREVAERAESSGHRTQEIDARSRLARAELDRGNNASARREIERALKLAEPVTAALPSDRLRASYGETLRDLYDMALEIELLESGIEPEARIEEIFRWIEAARARGLRQLLEEAPADARVALEPQLVEEERRLRRRLEELSSRILEAESDSSGGAVESSAAREELRAVEFEFEALAARRQRLHPIRGSMLSGSYAGLEAVIGDLDGHLLLEFHELPDRTLLLALCEHEQRLHQLPSATLLEPAIDRLLQTLRQPTRRRIGPFLSATRELSGTVLTPLGVHLETHSKILISPDGPLYRLPFEVLLTEEPPSPPSWRELRFAVERFEITYTPSATVHLRLRNREESGEGSARVVALADPDRTRSPDATHRAAGIHRAKHRSEFGPLPHARDEVRAIQRWFGERVAAYVGEEAGEGRVYTEEASAARYLHFATHGYLDERLSTQSALLLASDEGTDGLLQLREVLALRLSADLVVLSACETALGRQRRGEGMMSLSRAFLYAGARSLIASLWKVDDRATSELMSVLYSALADGVPAPTALARARRSLLADERTAHPYYWAPFLMIG